ncbi:hypothetical protein HCN44_005987 [Aphidius gifuensis]|uniref:N-acetylneuraminate lyase n=1 Tax=Aphidius gifuensis TaxID=684658 RepID=A0A834Y3M1_APHGI|nr:N-acetylneuraminate lyase-like [Aphidius gifuensis]KAF7997416.1 hypothetical protein HCN44_005987 [Aphidius gifuensis]
MPRLSYFFEGFCVPVFSPFTESFQLNLKIIPAYAKYLLDNGIKGVLVNGTTGEGMSMAVTERKQVAEAWAEAVKVTKQHLMIQIGGASLPDVVELAKHAEKINAESILCLPELYYKPTESKQLIDYLKIVGNAAPKTPLLYYHIPMFTKVNIPMGQFLEQIGDAVPTFVGIKYTSPNLEEGGAALRANNGKFTIFLGSDQIMSAGCAIGMKAFIPTSVNMFSKLGLEIIDAGMQGDFLKAKKFQDLLSQAVVAISKHGHWVATMKPIMARLSPIDPGPVRPPIQSISPTAIELIERDLRALGFSNVNN